MTVGSNPTKFQSSVINIKKVTVHYTLLMLGTLILKIWLQDFFTHNLWCLSNILEPVSTARTVFYRICQALKILHILTFCENLKYFKNHCICLFKCYLASIINLLYFDFTDIHMQLDPIIHGPISGHGGWGTGALNICIMF